MITYTVHSALYLLQTKISRLLIAGFCHLVTSLKHLKNTRYKLQNICQFTLLVKKYTTFYIKSKFMYVPFICHNTERALYYGSRIVH